MLGIKSLENSLNDIILYQTKIEITKLSKVNTSSCLFVYSTLARV